MNIDDIYTVAISGQKQELIQMLEAGEVDINERLDGGVTNGVHVYLPMFFSVLSNMNENGYKYDVLDILVQYGVDLDACVTLENDAYTRHIPYICYAIRDWKNLELVNYLLSRGANPNRQQGEKYADGHIEMYPLAYYAINFYDTTEALELLLHYGADPNMEVLTYNYEASARQTLPLAFSALVVQQSMEKTALLFAYGANANFELNVGYGMIQKYLFKRYIETLYSQFAGMLNSAIRYGKANRMKPSPVNRGDFLLNNGTENASGKKAKAEKEAAAPKTPEEELEDLAKTLLLFDHGFKKEYFDITAYLEKKPGFFERKKYKEAQERLQQIEYLHTAQIDELNKMDHQASRGKIDRWWNHFNGLTHCPRPINYKVIYLPFKRFTKMPDGYGLTPFCTAEETIRGSELSLLIKSGELKPLYMTKKIEDVDYTMAELCYWNVSDATEVTKTTTRLYDEKEIRDSLEKKRESMDRCEKFHHMIQGGAGFTAEEQHLAGEMKTSDFFACQAIRDSITDNLEKRMREATVTHVEMTNRRLFKHYIQPLGIVLFNEDKSVFAVLTNRESSKTEIYTVDFNKVLHDSDEWSPSGDMALNRIFILRELEGYPMSVKATGQKPSFLSEQEWYELIYACALPDNVKTKVQQRISEAYENAGAEKRATIRQNL